MTKKKKSILSDQRFIVLLVIIVLFAIFSFKSREFRQYTTILSMLDFSADMHIESVMMMILKFR